MPRVTTGNTMAPCVIIGERAAEILRAKHKLRTSGIDESGVFRGADSDPISRSANLERASV
jgi:choline dehydrogenase-like flavoprotein